MNKAEQVRHRLRQQGKTINQWAQEHNFPVGAVYRVMAGIDKGHYGRSHQIAVALGMKPDPARSAAPNV